MILSSSTASQNEFRILKGGNKIMEIIINKESTKEFDKSWGDAMFIEEFFECCKDGSFIDYDGYASEILWNNKVIGEHTIYPSEIHKYANQLKQLRRELGEIEIVWYNR
jgi:hypothetical protein